MPAKLDLLSQLVDKKEDDSSMFHDTVNKYLYHWPLFVLGVLIFIGAAFAYQQTHGPSYDITASVIINDEKKLPEDEQSGKTEEINLKSTPKLAENEIQVFKSRNLISKVVNHLHLWVSYQKKDGLKTLELYKKSPVVFKLLRQSDGIGGQVFTIIINDDKSFFIKRTDKTLVKFYFGQPLENDFGTWKLQPAQNISRFKGQEITIALSDPDKVAEAYQRNIDADLPNKLAPTIELTLKDELRDRGKDIINDLIAFYNSTTNQEENQDNQRTLDFISKRISDIAGELSTSENAVQGFKSSKGLTDISTQSEVYLQNVQANDQKLNETNVALNIIDEVQKSVNSKDNQSVPSTLGIVDDGVLAKSLDKLSELQLEHDKLLATTPETNPAFDPLNRQIKNTKKTINDEVASLKTSLLATKSQLQKYDSKVQSSIRNIPAAERQLVDKTRQQTIKESLYVYLLQKKEQIALNYASTVPDARIVDYAYAGSPKSKSMVVYGAALLLGLMFPPGFIYLRQISSNKITSRKEIEDGTEADIVGELSHVATRGLQITTREAGNIIIGEEFRSLRTNLYFLNKNPENGFVILITSSISSEGKSFVSTNLASVLALAGNKTVILEMDLRRPGVSSVFGLSAEHQGVSDHVVDKVPYEKIIQKTAVSPDLDVISSGFLPSEPSELLGRHEIDSLITYLRARYKYIIVDTPPLNLVTDAKILSRVSDMALYIIRQAYTFKSLLPFIRSVNENNEFPQLKIVFNDVEKERYGYGHNYGYDYYQSLNGKKAKASMFNGFFKRF
ncbi:MAG TPA: polysaccharide biosynthesis tyrosine autokinase [Mucilaginibacter sp.]|jgi:capsular exopolysaccharide synthesis family protein|nr:polysaccharide biosynthesis tyrosine autokinase [Mucilaginibacter sp.]